MSARRYPLLAGVVENLTGEGGHNLCFHRAAAFVLDRPGAVLCIGTLRGSTEAELAAMPGASPEPFIHAWAEVGGVVVAPTTIEAAGGLYAIPRAIYYATNGVDAVHKLDRASLKRLARGHDWPRYFRTGKRPLGAPLGAVLLEAAGVPHFVAAGGAVLPPRLAEETQLPE